MPRLVNPALAGGGSLSAPTLELHTTRRKPHLLPNVFLALPTMNAVDERNNAITAVIANGFKCNFLFFIIYFKISVSINIVI